MKKFADLEIGLHRHPSGGYMVEFRFNQPDSDTEERLGEGQTNIDLKSLDLKITDPADYAQELSRGFFSNPEVRSAFIQARTLAQSQDAPLRVRLFVGPSAPELHNLRWESLNDPRDGSPLCTGEDLYFSRFLTSLDWRPVRLRPRGELQALVMIANPKDLKQKSNLEPVDVEGELKRAKEGLKNIGINMLPDPGKSEYASLNQMVTYLRDNVVDILYLVCHGTLRKEEDPQGNDQDEQGKGETWVPYLWLEDEEGNTARTRATELVTRLKELTNRPRLVVLASCQSAGKGEGEALKALGPRLAEAGIPAVIAMQGNVTMETVATFMPIFFDELQKDGQIDRAMAVARGMVRQQPDFWMPALFMRLKSGRIWYVPGFGLERGDFEKWPTLVDSIEQDQCTPIIGPGLFEPLLGSLRDIAQRWAEDYRYPMEPHERESLPQVAQYLATNQSPLFPYNHLQKSLISFIRNRFGAILPEEFRQGRVALDDVLNLVGAERRKREPKDGYRLLAQLPFSIYITTNQGNLLASALEEAGRQPVVKLCPWNEEVAKNEALYRLESDPTWKQPLVYHLFGRLNEQPSVVLTEDNYFDFLIGVTKNIGLIPPRVMSALSNSALLFLGFQVDEWHFRVVLRFILSQEGSELLRYYPHIAAQIEPEEGRILEPERARRYLVDYFSKGTENAPISIYWGNTEDFLDNLVRRYNESV